MELEFLLAVISHVTGSNSSKSRLAAYVHLSIPAALVCTMYRAVGEYVDEW